jgi:NAD(P) transhydrogenase subunit alpha
MKIGVLKETLPGERRVALVPGSVAMLAKAGLAVVLETGAGEDAGFPDELYKDQGASIASRAEVFAASDLIVQVRTLGANPGAGRADLGRFRPGQAVVGLTDPLSAPEAARDLAGTGVMLFSMELMPRVTRAQTMDVLSSMSTISGYKAVLLAATTFHRMFPMSMTAAGTISPARVFVIGAGVAGLQAVATARKLGAVVHAYDVRPAVKEQVQSLGAKFVEMALDPADAQDAGGYAKALGEDFYRRQRELMTKVVAENDIVITTALVPGKKAPILITEEMVKGMPPGSVVVDLAAEKGGNCEITEPDRTVVKHRVTILGPTNLPATVPYHASQMYGRNVTTFLLHIVKEGRIVLNMEDDITRETLVTRDGKVVHARTLELLGEAPVQTAAPAGERRDA